MPTEREYLLKVYLGYMDELVALVRHLPGKKATKALSLCEAISNFLKSHIERECSNE